MMIKSDWRGLGRKTPAPKRSRSKREAPVAIISIAQHARPKVIGQRAELRPQLISQSILVVMKPAPPPSSDPTAIVLPIAACGMRHADLLSRLLFNPHSTLRIPHLLDPIECPFAPGIIVTDDQN